MAEHVDDVAVGVADEEAAPSPRLVSEGVRDLGALTDGGGVRGVNVIDLNREVRNDGRGLVVGQQADLRTRPAWVRQGDDPAVVHHRLKAEDSPYKPLASSKDRLSKSGTTRCTLTWNSQLERRPLDVACSAWTCTDRRSATATAGRPRGWWPALRRWRQ